MVKNNTKIGIMNGRLSLSINNQIQCFPINSWKNEFQLAHDCGFDTLEWIFDLKQNPILQNEGIDEIKTLSKKHDIKISAVCADYFMEKKLFGVAEFELEQNINTLKKIIQQCSKLEIQILEIPLVDSSSLKTKNNKKEIVQNLQSIVNFAKTENVKIVLETDLAPNDFKDLLEQFGTSVGANYDTGNSASLGYDPKKEIQTLKPWITNVHIKDRLYEGNTVMLGSGDTNFDLVFSTLAKINYNGQLIIQGAREEQKMIAPHDTCKKYLKFVKEYVIKYNLGTQNNRN